MSYQNLSKEIQSLEIYLGDEEVNTDAVLETMQKLGDVLENVANAHQDWDNDQLREFVLSENDPLDLVEGVSDSFRESVREIQHGIINYYSS